MHKFIQKLIEDTLMNSDFRIEQNEIAKGAYDTLNASYSRGDNEVQMVTSLCNYLNDKRCGQAKVYAKKIHGSASQVEFFNGSRKVHKELADMVIISIATSNKKVIFEKIAFIQNKKEDTSGKWKIDQDQLYLLHNMPTFDGVKGIFGKQRNIALPNALGRLGNYGLFLADGDMVFANASIVNALQDKTIISYETIRRETTENKNNRLLPYPFSPMLMDELYYHLRKTNFLLPLFLDPPILLNNCDVALNLYQLIRNWTQFNIGEIVICGEQAISSDLVNLINNLLAKAQLHNLLNYDFDKRNNLNEWGYEFDGALLVYHYDIED